MVLKQSVIIKPNLMNHFMYSMLIPFDYFLRFDVRFKIKQIICQGGFAELKITLLYLAYKNYDN